MEIESMDYKEILTVIASQLITMNEKSDDIKGIGLYNSLSDVFNKLDSLEGEVRTLSIDILRK